MIKGKGIIGKAFARFGRLEKSQRVLLIFLVVTVVFSVYFNAIYKPQSKALKKAKVDLAALNDRISQLKTEMPDVNKEKELLKAAKANLDSLKSQLASLESQLPPQGRISALLRELIRQASGYSIDFVSIRPAAAAEQKEYAELIIEMKLASDYKDFVNYLHRVENLSYFLTVTDIAMDEPKEAAAGMVEAKLVLATLLGEERAGETEEEKEEKFISALSIDHNPFASKSKPIKQEIVKKKAEEYKLSGIIATGKQPVAIINDDVYQLGDKVGDKVVKQITRNEVVLADEKDRIVLSLEKIDEVKR